MSGEPLLRKFVAGLEVEAVTVDLNISTDGHVGRCDEATIISVSVLVFAALEEFTLKDARVLLSRLIYRDRIVSQEERYNEWKKIWIPERTYNRYFEWLKKILWDDFDQSLYFETFSVEYKKILTII